MRLTEHHFLFLLACLMITAGWLTGCAEKPAVDPLARQYDQARQAAQEMLGPVHPVAKRLYEEAMRAYQDGDYEDAAMLFGQAAGAGGQRHVLRADSLVYQCLCLLRLKKYHDAYQIAAEAIQDYPKRWELRLVIIDYLLYRQETALAQQQLQVGLLFAPAQPELLRAAARAAQLQGDLQAAEDYARQAVGRRLTEPLFRQHLGEIYTKRAMALSHWEASDEALVILYSALAYQAEDKVLPFMLARVLLMRGELAVARQYVRENLPAAGAAAAWTPETLNQALFLLPTVSATRSAQEHRRLAENHRERGELKLAALEYEAALAAEAGNADSWLQLGLLSVQLENAARARECLFALWVLAARAEQIASLEALLKPNYRELAASPGFVVRAATGNEYNAATGEIDERAEEMKIGRRIYFSLVLGNAVGRHEVYLRVLDPNGETAIDERIGMDFFGSEFRVLRSGTFWLPGQWQVQWYLDGALRAKAAFALR